MSVPTIPPVPNPNSTSGAEIENAPEGGADQTHYTEQQADPADTDPGGTTQPPQPINQGPLFNTDKGTSG